MNESIHDFTVGQKFYKNSYGRKLLNNLSKYIFGRKLSKSTEVKNNQKLIKFNFGKNNQ